MTSTRTLWQAVALAVEINGDVIKCRLASARCRDASERSHKDIETLRGMMPHFRHYQARIQEFLPSAKRLGMTLDHLDEYKDATERLDDEFSEDGSLDMTTETMREILDKIDTCLTDVSIATQKLIDYSLGPLDDLFIENCYGRD